jgi:hypothetical protein
MKFINFIGTGIIWVILSIALIFLIAGSIIFYLFLGLIFGVIFLFGGLILLVAWIFFSRKNSKKKKK